MKKHLFTLIFMGFTLCLWAQPSNRINYQGIARTIGGPVVANGTAINLRFTLLEGAASGAIVYQETATKTVLQFGLFNHNLGDGVSSFNFNTISWATKKWLKVEVDAGSGFQELSNEELKAVPFANYAATAAKALTIPNPFNESFKINSTGGFSDPT